MTRDPLIRRFITTCLFAAAFVWVAVEFFGVETDVVWRFLGGSVILVVAMIGIAWLASLILVRLRKARGSFLDDTPDRKEPDDSE